MIPIKKALKIVNSQAKVLGTESINLVDAVGRVLAEDIRADMDLPPFDRSQMDGYAVIASDTTAAPALLRLVGESAAGRGWHGRLKPGEAVRIMTGASIPKGADAVQRVEVTREDGDTVTINEPVKKGMSIVRKGAETKKGKLIFKNGESITVNMIPVLASFGYSRVKVGRKPRVSIMGTGTEIVDIDRRPGPDQIRNSNSVMLAVMSRRSGASATVLQNVHDNIEVLKKEIHDASRSADVLLITGGVSVGKYDHTKTALKELKAEIFFEKLRLKPGKPTVFARLEKMLVFGLPGNPVSAATAFNLLAMPAIRKMQGSRRSSLTSGIGIAAATFRGTNDRDSYLPSRLSYSSVGSVEILPLKSQGSSDFVALSKADCMAVIPRGTVVESGMPVEFLILDQG